MERKKSLSGIKIWAIDGAADTLPSSIVSSPVHMFPGELSSHSTPPLLWANRWHQPLYTFELLSVIVFISEVLSYLASHVCNHTAQIVCYFRGDLPGQMELQILFCCMVNEGELRSLNSPQNNRQSSNQSLLCVGTLKILTQLVILISVNK